MAAVLKCYSGPALLLPILVLAGCAASTAPSSSRTVVSTAVAVAVSGPAQANVGAAAQYTATVTGTPNAASTWSVNAAAGGSAAYGTISSTGLYAPPASVPTQNTITITATSQADTTKTASESVLILNAVATILSVISNADGNGGLMLNVTGTNFMQGSVMQAAGQNLSTTFVSATQVTATIPSTPAPGSQLAIVVKNPSPGATQSVAYNFTVPGLPTASVVVSGSSQVNAGTASTYSATVTGVSNTAVTWAVNGVTGGSTTYGAITASGIYSAPSTIPAQNVITISAVSAADSTLTGSLGVTIVGDVPTISGATAAYNAEGSILIDVSGSNFMVSSAAQVSGSNLATTYLSAKELKATLPSPPTAGAQVPLLVVNPNSTQSAAHSLWIPASVSAATRLIEQSTFGPTDTLIAHVQAVGLSGFLDEQLAVPTTLMPDLPNPLPTRCATFAVLCNEENWWSTALTGNDQLRQRVAFTLGQIFVISYLEVDGKAFPPYQNWLANDAFSNWSTIMHDVTLSPGMGNFLNMINSGKPAAGAIANENFARENLQLFNLGLNLVNPDGTAQLDAGGKPISTFSELQVEAFARVFTGWTYAPTGGAIPGKFPNRTANYDALMVPVDSAHDTTAKILLKTTLPAGQTAQQDLDGALADIFSHPNVGPFVSKQLIQHLVKSNPTPPYVARVAAMFADDGSGVRGDMPAVLKAIFLDPEARAGDTTPAIADGHLREPILWTANVMRALSAKPAAGITDGSAYDNLDFADTSQMGQLVFRPPSVFNFYPPDYEVPGTSMLGPEFALETTGTSMQKLTVANHIVGNSNGNLSVDLSATSPLGVLAISSNNALLDELNKLLMHGQMSTQMRTAILNTITPFKDPAQRVRVAVYLVITSTQYKVAH